MKDARALVSDHYTYVWEFIVRPDHTRAFEDAYGESGEWVLLFRRAPGYIRSQLYRDRGTAGRYLTIDYWESESAWNDFLSRFAAEFAALDAKCAAWTIRETKLGEFTRVAVE